MGIEIWNVRKVSISFTNYLSINKYIFRTVSAVLGKIQGTKVRFTNLQYYAIFINTLIKYSKISMVTDICETPIKKYYFHKKSFRRRYGKSPRSYFREKQRDVISFFSNLAIVFLINISPTSCITTEKLLPKQKQLILENEISG